MGAAAEARRAANSPPWLGNIPRITARLPPRDRNHASPRRADILAAASLFVDAYLDALRSLRPADVAFSPCFGYGRGGVAYALLRAGVLRRDRALIEAARRWTAAAITAARRLPARGWPRGSFSRGLTGLHAIHALATHAAGDAATCRRELGRFVAAARRARGSVELFQGTAGRLAGAGLVLRSIPDPGVRALGDQLAATVVRALGSGRRLAPVGLAHGTSGVVLGALAWQAAAGSLPRDALVRAVRAEHPYKVPPTTGWASVDWAHGHAGMALLFARAYSLLGERRFLGWARKAATLACARPSIGTSLLNGSTGVAYCLLAVAAADPAGPWRDLAWTVAAQMFAQVDVPGFAPYGAWSGLGGVCCLALDLLHDTAAGFPGVEA